MSRFEEIRVRGYRRLQDVTIPMRPFVVLIGANGAGKTSFLEVWSLLAASSMGRLSSKLSELGGLAEVLTRDRVDRLSIDVSMSVPDSVPLKYHVELVPHGPSYQITEETLSQKHSPNKPAFTHIQSSFTDIKYYNVKDKKLIRPNWEHNPQETSLSQVPKMYQEPENLRRHLS